jgi:hypothetical protein
MVLRRRLVLAAGVLIGLGLAWVLITGFLARQQAADLALRIQQVKLLVAQGRVDDARKLGRDIPAMADRTRHLTSGPAWWIGAHIPFLGSPLDQARSTAAVVDEIGGQAVPRLLAVAKDIDPARLRADGHTIRLAPLSAAEPDLVAVDRVLGDALHRLDGGGTWLSAFDVSRAKLRDQVSAVRGYVDAAARVARVFPTMLGDEGTQRYFIALQNEAEIRGTGGLPGAFAIARVTGGSITFERFESDSVLLPAKSNNRIDTGLDFGPEYDALYGAAQPTRTYNTSNVSPDFRAAAQIWAAMWHKVSGEQVDGVIALDPTAVSYFLDATGPAYLTGYGGSVTSANVVSLTQRDEYVLFPDNAARKKFLVAVLKAAAKKVTSGSGSALDLLEAASRSASEQRLLVWHREPQIEKELQQTDYAGTIPDDDRPFSAVVVNNAAAGKLDYYLYRTENFSRTGCGPRRDVVITVTLTNSAPAGGLPPYVVTRLDHPPKGAKPGDNHVLLDYFATAGARLQSVTVDGKQSVASVQTYLGHAVFRLDLELPRGKSRTVTLHLDEPAMKGTPRIWRQPGVNPLTLQVFNQSCT